MPATVLALWMAGDVEARTVLTTMMKANTSCCLALMAASLLLSIRGGGARARASRARGSDRRSRHSSNTSRESISGSTSFSQPRRRSGEGFYPGRMAPNAAQAIATLAVSLALFPDRGRRRTVAAWLAIVVLLEAVLALLGYLHGTRSLYQITRTLRISEYTVVGRCSR